MQSREVIQATNCPTEMQVVLDNVNGPFVQIGAEGFRGAKGLVRLPGVYFGKSEALRIVRFIVDAVGIEQSDLFPPEPPADEPDVDQEAEDIATFVKIASAISAAIPGSQGRISIDDDGTILIELQQ